MLTCVHVLVNFLITELATSKYHNETVGASIIVHEGCFTIVKLSKSVGRFLNFMIIVIQPWSHGTCDSSGT